MGVPVDLIAQPEVALLRLLVAALVGGLIGVERERVSHAAGERMFAGVRTFPIFAILGACLSVAEGRIGLATVAGFVAVAALAVVAYWRTSGSGEVGTTTESAGLVTYWVGAVAGTGALLLAGAIGITVAVLLASKDRLEAFPKAMTREELRATLTLAVIAAVILPILPDRGYGPWQVWNPRTLWGVVVLVCGVSFAAFLAMRLWGARRGVYLSGILGGLVSSTAITVSFATHSRLTPGRGGQLAAASGLASMVMLARVAFFAAIVGPSVLRYLVPFLAVMALAGAIAVAILIRRHGAEGPKETGVTNPFQLREAIRWALIYAVVLLVVETARRELGSWGMVAASMLAGFVDMDAITLSLATMSGTGLPPETAAGGIALATLSSTAAKAGYAAWRGDRAYAQGLALILGISLLAGGAAILLFGLKPLG